jgi:hypothetical protein
MVLMVLKICIDKTPPELKRVHYFSIVLNLKYKTESVAEGYFD